ncbi:MAG: lasso RiPP family leader peptide-containing protein [Gemmatimonadaceae bacterium]
MVVRCNPCTNRTPRCLLRDDPAASASLPLASSRSPRRSMYEKPKLERYGTLRELTLIGFGPDGDGGLFGTGWIDGPWGSGGSSRS